MLNKGKLREQIREWLEEDIGYGDITTYATVSEGETGKGVIYTKERGILVGLPVIQAIFKEVDPELKVFPQMKDGQIMEKGDIIVELSGSIHSILTGERVALNIVQRLSGIATKTSRLVQEAKKRNPQIRIVDTRKTTPGLRMIEKYAVQIGGGHPHRYGLYDAVLIKDNHIKAAGGIEQAVRKAREIVPHTMKIEVEVESIPEVYTALQAGTDIIMFDNMDVEQMKEAISIIGDRAVTEASGGIRIENIGEIASLGIDVISLGSLTYSINNIDISLDLFGKKLGR